MINMLTISRDEQFIDREEELSFLEEGLARRSGEAHLRPSGPLYLEPELLLKTELREHVMYFKILRRLAGGKRSFSEPASSLGSARTSLSYYLGVTAR